MADLKANYERNKAWAKIGPYETALNSNQEKQFLQWVGQNKIPFDPNEEMQDYDMRGYYKALTDNKVAPRDPAGNMHFPDTFKTPYHETFSNESRYANYDAPRWMGDDASGFRLIDKEGNILFDESVPPLPGRKPAR
jgi:hypothetical protein